MGGGLWGKNAEKKDSYKEESKEKTNLQERRVFGHLVLLILPLKGRKTVILMSKEIKIF